MQSDMCQSFSQIGCWIATAIRLNATTILERFERVLPLLRLPTSAPPLEEGLVASAVAPSTDGPLVVLDGNHRLLALFTMAQLVHHPHFCRPGGMAERVGIVCRNVSMTDTIVSVVVGIAPRLAQWAFRDWVGMTYVGSRISLSSSSSSSSSRLPLCLSHYASCHHFCIRHGFVCDPSALVSAAACEATDLELEHDTLPPRVLDMSLRAYTSASPDMRHLTAAALRATVKETVAAEAAALKHVGLLTHAEYDGT